MGDRCYLSMSWNRKDSEKLAAAFVKEGLLDKGKPLSEAFNEYDESTVDEMVTGSMEEANYACSSELQNVARAGIVFAGHNSAGDDYGHGEWVSWRGEFIEVESTVDGDGPAVLVHSNGKPDHKQLSTARRYWKAVLAAYKYIKGTKHQRKAA